MKSTKKSFTSIDEYIATFPEHVQAVLKQVRATIKAAAPQAQEKISYGIPTFTLHGKYLIYFAGWKHHVSIYPIPAGDQEFQQRISSYVAGKGTLKFPLDRPLPLDLVDEMVRLQITSNLERTGQTSYTGIIRRAEMKKITPFLWFDNQAEHAMNFYISLFKNSKAGEVRRGPDGKVFSVTFQLDGQDFMAMNAGPQFKFNEAISLYVDCRTQEEVDYFWAALSADGGEESMCGWVKDKFGLWWQIVPSVLDELMGDPDRAKAQRVTQAMLKMRKIDIAGLRKAAEEA